MSAEVKSASGSADVRWVDVYYGELAKAAEPITEPVTKVGGAPVFMQTTDWPVCRECRLPMQFLAQFRLDHPLPLARQYQMAYIFICLTCEGSCEPYNGLNAVLLQPATSKQWVRTREGQYPDYTVTLTPGKEPWIDRTNSAVDEALRDQVELVTKLGGTPGWIECAVELGCPQCGGPTKFIAQLEEFGEWGEFGEWNERQARLVDQDFGHSISSYLFLCKKECGPHSAAFFWPCM
jgi:hypothetical protein